MSYVLILNPTAGKGRARERVPQIDAFFTSRGLDHEIRYTEGKGHAIALAEEAAKEGVEILFAAGGDGTYNEVVNGLMNSRARGRTQLPVMGILPLGRGNDFCYGAGVPEKLEAALEKAAAMETRVLDVGKISGGFFPQGRYFVNGVGVGFDAIVGLKAAKIHWARGFLGYIIGTISTFIHYPIMPEMDLICDGELKKMNPIQISIMNGKRMGGAFYMAPEGDVSDGIFDVCITRSVTRRKLFDIVFKGYTSGTQGKRPDVDTFTLKEMVINSPQGKLICHADGETICEDGKYLKIEMIPGAIRYIF